MLMTDQRSGVRAARAAASCSLDDVATSTGADTAVLVEQMRALPARGRCAQIAARFVSSGQRRQVLAHRVCSPSQRRVWQRPADSGGIGEGTAMRVVSRLLSVRLPEFDGPIDEQIAAAIYNDAVGGAAGWHTRRSGGVDMTRAEAARLASADEPFRAFLAAPLVPPLHDQARSRVVLPHRPVSVCPPVMLHSLAFDSNPFVRAVVARSLASDRAALGHLAADTNPMVRYEIALNRRCSPSTLTRLIQDSLAGVRAHAAANPSTPISALRRINADVLSMPAFRETAGPLRRLLIRMLTLTNRR